jgi:hypothetical protein
MIPKRKYIDDLGIKYKDTPQGWCTETNDGRIDKWKKEREEYGFDSRETWAMEYNFKLWLYERLMMYNEINCVDTSCHKFEYKNQTITQQDCIDRILEGLKLDLTSKQYDESSEKEEINEKIEDVLPLFNLCFHTLWW